MIEKNRTNCQALKKIIGQQILKESAKFPGILENNWATIFLKSLPNCQASLKNDGQQFLQEFAKLPGILGNNWATSRRSCKKF